ncbi:MAG: hypothetical protein JAZ06_10220 [Candidatus Thiodiazotropha taylori]|nr:hypothetical protein [Candidatus Thiodiazotropha taylori]
MGGSFGHIDGAFGGIIDSICPIIYSEYDGVVYEDNAPTSEIFDTIKTKPCQDKNIFKWMYDQLHDSYPYSLGGNNCITYSKAMMNVIRHKLNNGDFDENCECEE